MSQRWFTIGLVMLLLAAGCRKKMPAPPPPPAGQNVFVLLPSESGKPSSITVSNAGGSQTLTESYQAVRVERADSAPTAPSAMDKTEVQRIFGPALEVLPAAEVVFTLYFDEDRDVLNERAMAQIPEIFKTIQERHSTDVSITGHTDTVGSHEVNYQLGLRRAQRVAEMLAARGLDVSHMSVASHGDADLLVQTPRGVSEERNRRVEVIVR
jgi:outer membrane protein OmpA-like peptidoglycan-associated protein